MAQSFEFNKLLFKNTVQMKTIAGYASKLNKIIESINRNYHIKLRIALSIQKLLDKLVWCFAREYINFIKHHT